MHNAVSELAPASEEVEYLVPKQEFQAERRIPALDGLRGIAILSVMIYHQTVMTSTTAVDQAFTAVTGFGWAGVNLFFVLSGFLITGILVDAKGSTHFFRNFYGRRVLRIFPLYYAIVIFALVILPHIPNPKSANFARIDGSQGWYWVYLQNYSIAAAHRFRSGILDVSWSLAIEEQFYLVWPFLIFVLPRRMLGWVLSAIIGAAIISRLVLVILNIHWISIYVLTSSQMDSLAIGAAVALLVRSKYASELRRWATIVAIAAAIPLIPIVVTQSTTWVDGAGQAFGYTLLGLVFGGILALTVTGSPTGILHRWMSAPWLRFFGKYSYAMYLFHLPLRALIRDEVFGPHRHFFEIHGSMLLSQLVFYPIATAVTIVAAVGSWHLYEKQFLKLKRFIPMGRPIRDVNGKAAIPLSPSPPGSTTALSSG
jgi:peptidoglycan/LPS O-acetylase OafA/YrhL